MWESRKAKIMVGGLVRCSTRLLQKEQKTQQQRKRKRGHCGDEAKAVGPSLNTAHRWFSGKSFYLCRSGKQSGSKVSYICKLPGSWLEKSFLDDMVRKAKKKSSEKLLESYHHSVRHEDQPPYALSQTCLLRYSLSSINVRAGASAWVALGSTIYLFGGYGKEGIASRNIFSIQTIGAFSAEFSKGLNEAGWMVSRRYKAKVVAMDGKIFVFGGVNKHSNEAVWAEVFEPEPNNPIGHSRALLSPPLDSTFADVDVYAAVAVEKERKIIVCFNSKIYGYDVDGNSWGGIVVDDPTFFSIEPRNPYCQPVAVGRTLYWLDGELMAYDLEKKQLYKGPIEDRLLQHYLSTPDSPYEPKDFQVSLVHLGRNCFCVIWVERDIPENLHFTVIRAIKLNPVFGNYYNLRVSVLSCQTIFSPSPLKLKDSVLMI